MSETNSLERRYVRAALHAFAKRGYFGTTMNHIADEAGVSQPRISQVFDGKLSAYLAAHEVALDVVLGSFREVEASTSFDPAAVGRTFLQLLHDNPDMIMVVLHTVSSGQAEPRIADAARQALGQLSDLLADRFAATPQQIRDFLASGFFTMILVGSGLPDPEATASLNKVAEVTPGVIPPEQG